MHKHLFKFVLSFNTSNVSVEFGLICSDCETEFTSFNTSNVSVEFKEALKALARNKAVSILQMYRLNRNFDLRIEGVEKVSILQMYRLNFARCAICVNSPIAFQYFKCIG